MSDLRDHDIIEKLVEGIGIEEELRPLGAELRRLRASAKTTVDADHRLVELFDGGLPAPPPPRRRWLQRPAVAFTAAFLGVLLLGAGAFALANRGGEAQPVARASVSSVVTTQTPDAAAALTVVEVPDEVGQSVGEYLRCVVFQVGEYLGRRLGDSSVLDRPRVLAECGVPSVSFLGEEAERYRLDLNAWLSCAAARLDDALPELLTDPGAIADPLGDCGIVPNPLDYDLSFDFDGFDLRFLEDIELPDLDLDGILDRFGDRLPEDFFEKLPEGLQMPDLERLFEEFSKNLPEDFEGFGDLDLRGLLDGFGQEFDPEQLERLWRDLGDRLPELDGLFDGFLDRLPDDFEFDDLEMWFNGEHLVGDEACEALRALGVVTGCDASA